MRAAILRLMVLTTLESAGALGSCPRALQAGDPLAVLTADELARFNAGKAIFE